MNKKKILKDYPLEVLIKVIYDMGEFIIDVQEEEELPDVILQALTIGCAVINESQLDLKEIEGLNLNSYMIGLS
tara:strand:- start:80 stop:301 length:222 start_codon:yes stop_codon:yes gene_type:complete